MVICGIDPGQKGGISFLTNENLVMYPTPVYDVQFVKSGKKRIRKDMDCLRVAEIIREHAPDLVILERVTARPGQGVTSMFRFGQNFGQYEGIVHTLGIKLHHVTPQAWKKHFDLPSEKYAALALANSLFEGHEKIFKLKKNDGLAESALMAKYGMDNKDILE